VNHPEPQFVYWISDFSNIDGAAAVCKIPIRLWPNVSPACNTHRLFMMDALGS